MRGPLSRRSLLSAGVALPGLFGPLALFAPLLAQDNRSAPPARSAYEIFALLVGRPELRSLFGLPEGHYWKSRVPIRIVLVARDAMAMERAFRAWAGVFQEATGLGFTLNSAALTGAPAAALDRAARQADLVFLVAPRSALTDLAVASSYEAEMTARFEQGQWPMAFRFRRDRGPGGEVLVADDQPVMAMESLMILAIVWALGGATLGREMHGLIAAEQGRPALTPRGRAVFRLLYHPELQSGMPLEAALEQARGLAGAG